MRKVLVWIRIIFYLLPMWITAHKCRKEPYDVRYAVVKHWCSIIVRAGGAKTSCTGRENVPSEETVYFVSNHQGSLDPFIFVTETPVPATAISKVENEKIPVIGAWMKTLEIISFQRDSLRDSLRMVKETAATLKKGRDVVCYPEGTRSKCPRMNEFKPGALKPALMAGVSIVPIAMHNSYLIDVGGRQDANVSINFLPKIPYEQFKDMSTTELAKMLQEIIQKKLDELDGKTAESA